MSAITCRPPHSSHRYHQITLLLSELDNDFGFEAQIHRWAHMQCSADGTTHDMDLQQRKKLHALRNTLQLQASRLKSLRRHSSNDHITSITSLVIAMLAAQALCNTVQRCPHTITTGLMEVVRSKPVSTHPTNAAFVGH
jgi:hypothetical protein